MTATFTQTPLVSRPIGEIAAELPGATAVFRKFKLDFCCSGEIALAEAVHKRGVELECVEEELQALLEENQPAVAPSETSALIDHILERYHDTHRRELPELARLARRVEKVHAEHSQAPYGLANLIEIMIGELEVHMKKEELILFPSMRRQPCVKFDPPIEQMRHDHQDHGNYLRRIEELTENFQLPDDACRSWKALYTGASKFVDDLMEHVHLENNVLFPRFESRP